MSFNTVYIKNNLAVKIAADPEWLAINSAAGTLSSGNSSLVEVTYVTEDFPFGTYTMDIQVTSNDPAHQTINVPVSLEIKDNEVPVELTSFTVESSNKGAILNWSTATEANNSGFKVERNFNNSTWQEVTFVNGKGNSTEKSSYQFTDGNLAVGKYAYRLKQIDFNGSFNYSPSVEVEVTAPREFSLEQNYPNPFNPSTVISYTLPEKVNVNIAIYNSLGELILTLVNQTQEAGVYHKEFNASSFSSGTYIYRINATGQNGTFTQSKKMILVK